MIAQSYIRAETLTTEQLEELNSTGTVEHLGAVYTVWNTDAAGDLWLKRMEAAKSVRQAFPEIFAAAEDDDDAAE